MASPSRPIPAPPSRELFEELAREARDVLLRVLHGEASVEEATAFARRLGQIIELAALRRGEHEAFPAPTSVAELARWAAGELEEEAVARDVTVEVRVGEPLESEAVETDGGQLGQILLTLVGAAVRSSSPGPVGLALEKTPSPGATLRIAIENSGPGWPTPWIEALGDLEGLPGALAGEDDPVIAIRHAAALARSLGARLELANPGAPDACVRLDLPLEPRAEPPDPSEGGLAPDLDARILLTDDSSEVRQRLAGTLEGLGARIDLARDGVEALARLAEGEEPHDVILLDLRMPGLDAHQTIREIRRRGHDAVVIALTDEALRAERDSCLQEGFDGFITPPYDENKLILLIRSSLAARED